MMACVLTACLFTISGIADARERGDGSGVPGATVREGQRHELRSVLTSGHEIGGKSAERRRLNAEERSALHRDLRDAMRGAYPEQQPGPSRTKSR